MINSIARLAGTYLNLLAYVHKNKCSALGYRLCSHPIRPALDEFQKQFLYPAKSTALEFDNLNLQTYRWGAGAKKIVFLHGWQSHSFRWKSYIESLPQDEYSMYALDAPGHGLSEGDLLNAPYYSAAIKNYLITLGPVDTVVAHSVGAFAILHAIYHHPGLAIKKMIIMASPTEAKYFMDYCQKALGLSDRAIRLIRTRFEEVFLQSLDEFSAKKFVTGITLPGLIIHDAEDDETPYPNILEIHHQWKNSSLLTTTGLGHKLKSPRVIEAVKDYIMDKINEESKTLSPDFLVDKQ